MKELTNDYWFTNKWSESLGPGGRFFDHFVYDIIGRPGACKWQYSFIAYAAIGGLPGWNKDSIYYQGETDWYCILEQHLAEKLLGLNNKVIKSTKVIL